MHALHTAMPPTQSSLICLEGLSVGDAFGQMFFALPVRDIRDHRLPAGPWHWTDDTHMALSIFETLARYECIEQDALVTAFARRFAEEPRRGYGFGSTQLLTTINAGGRWRDEAPRLFGIGSFGNGAAMRAAPIGAYFSGDAMRAAHEAQLSAQTTHAHIDGQAGAMAVAAAAAWLTAGDTRETGELLFSVASLLPTCAAREGIERASEIPRADHERAVTELGTGEAFPRRTPFRSASGAPCTTATISARRFGKPSPDSATATRPAPSSAASSPAQSVARPRSGSSAGSRCLSCGVNEYAM